MSEKKGGWVKLHRELLEWEWFRDSQTLHLFIYLLLSANHDDGRFMGVEVFKGQVVTGLPSMSEATGLSIQALRTRLRRLESTGEISKKSTGRFSIITINNYSKYQTLVFPSQQASNRLLTGFQQATNNKQEEEEGKEEKNNVEQVPYAKIISLLNEVTGCGFQPTTKAYRTLIKARWSEGHRFAQFEAVIRFKASQWKTDSKMCEYLRPQTLFSGKFDGYLQAARAAHRSTGGAHASKVDALIDKLNLDRGTDG